jgi:hypothetical protein
VAVRDYPLVHLAEPGLCLRWGGPDRHLTGDYSRRSLVAKLVLLPLHSAGNFFSGWFCRIAPIPQHPSGMPSPYLPLSSLLPGDRALSIHRGGKRGTMKSPHHLLIRVSTALLGFWPPKKRPALDDQSAQACYLRWSGDGLPPQPFAPTPRGLLLSGGGGPLHLVCSPLPELAGASSTMPWHSPPGRRLFALCPSLFLIWRTQPEAIHLR